MGDATQSGGAEVGATSREATPRFSVITRGFGFVSDFDENGASKKGYAVRFIGDGTARQGTTTVSHRMLGFIKNLSSTTVIAGILYWLGTKGGTRMYSCHRHLNFYFTSLKTRHTHTHTHTEAQTHTHTVDRWQNPAVVQTIEVSCSGAMVPPLPLVPLLSSRSVH